jgi:hypothetical protein
MRYYRFRELHYRIEETTDDVQPGTVTPTGRLFWKLSPLQQFMVVADEYGVLWAASSKLDCELYLYFWDGEKKRWSIIAPLDWPDLSKLVLVYGRRRLRLEGDGQPCAGPVFMDTSDRSFWCIPESSLAADVGVPFFHDESVPSRLEPIPPAPREDTTSSRHYLRWVNGEFERWGDQPDPEKLRLLSGRTSTVDGKVFDLYVDDSTDIRWGLARLPGQEDRAARANVGKLPWNLLPWDAMVEVAKLFQKGSQKYEPRNWEKGLSYDETFASLMRHATDWYLRKGKDERSGLSHMVHVIWNALVLVAFEVRGRDDLDDRPHGDGGSK